MSSAATTVGSVADTLADTLPVVRRDMARLRLRRAAVAGAALAMAAAGAAWYGYDWWTSGRFIQTTDDAYVGGNVTAGRAACRRLRRRGAGDRQPARQSRPGADPPRRSATSRPRWTTPTAVVAARTAALDGLRAQYVLQQSTIRQQEADLAAKTAQASFAATDAARYRSLAQTAAGSRQDAQRTNALEREARAAVLAADAGAGGRAPATEGAGRADRRGRRRRRPGAGRPRRPPGSTWATPRSARRSTAMSATAPPQVGAYVAAGTYLVSVIPSAGLWVDANFKEDQLARMVAGHAGHRQSRTCCRPCLPRPCRQPRARHRRRVQRHPARERHRQLHQDRAARAGAHRARRRRRRRCACCGRACRPVVSVDTRARAEAGAVITDRSREHPVDPALRGDVRRHVHGAAGHPDRRVLAAGYRRRTVGGAGRDQLGADRLSDRRDRHDPAVRLADAGVLHALAVHHLLRRLHGHQHAVRPGLEHPEHDRVPRAAGAARRVDDPDGVHVVILLFPGHAAGLFGGRWSAPSPRSRRRWGR